MPTAGSRLLEFAQKSGQYHHADVRGRGVARAHRLVAGPARQRAVVGGVAVRDHQAAAGYAPQQLEAEPSRSLGAAVAHVAEAVAQLLALP